MFGKEKKWKNQIQMFEQVSNAIDSLTEKDFHIHIESGTGRLMLFNDDAFRALKMGTVCRMLDGSVECKGFAFPAYSAVKVQDYAWYVSHNEESICMLSEPFTKDIDSEAYFKFLQATQNCNCVQTEAFVMEISLINEDVLNLLLRWVNQYPLFYTAIEYKHFYIERYNVPYILTENKPFTEQEGKALIPEIKERLYKALCPIDEIKKAADIMKLTLEQACSIPE